MASPTQKQSPVPYISPPVTTGDLLVIPQLTDAKAQEVMQHHIDISPQQAAAPITVCCVIDRLSDFSWFLRLNPQTLAQVMKIDWLWKAAPSTNAGSLVQQTMGLQSAINIPNGVISGIGAKNAYNLAAALKDQDGKVEAGVALFRSGVQTTAGAAFLGFRCASIVGLLQSHASATLAAATLGLGILGCSLFGLFFALFGGVSIYKLKQDLSFQKELAAHQAKGSRAVLQFLMTKLERDSKAAWKQLNPEKKEELREDALNALTDHLLQSEENRGCNREELKQRISNNSQELKGLPEYAKCVESLGLSDETVDDPLLLFGFAADEALSKQRMERALANLTSGAAVAEIKALAERHLKGESFSEVDLQKLCITVESAAKKSRYLHIAMVAISAIGIATMVLSCLTPVGWIWTATMITSVLLIGGMFALDSYFAKGALESKDPIGKYDKAYIKGALALTVFSFALSAVFIAITAVTIGAALAYLAPAALIFLMAIYIYNDALDRLSAREIAAEDTVKKAAEIERKKENQEEIENLSFYSCRSTEEASA